MSNTIEYLAVAETSEDVDEILYGLSLHNLKLNLISWLAVEIEADIALRKKNIVPIPPTSILTIEDRESIFLDAVKWSEKWLDETGLNDTIHFPNNNITLSKLVEDHIYYCFDDILYLVTVLQNIIYKLQPKVIIISSQRPETVRGMDHRTQYYLRRISHRITEKLHVRILEIHSTPFLPSSNTKKHKTGIDKQIGRISNKLLQMFNKYNNPKTKPSSIIRIGNTLHNKTILVLGGSRTCPYLRLESLSHFLQESYNCQLIPVYDSHKEFKNGDDKLGVASKRNTLRKTSEFLEFKECISRIVKTEISFKTIYYKDINLNDFFHQKLCWILNEFVPEYFLDCLSLNKIFSEGKIDLLIGAFNASASPLFTAALHCCKHTGIPTLLIPHGVQFCRYPEHNKIDRGYNFISPFNYSHIAVVSMFVYTKFTETGTKKNHIRCTGNLETVGAIKLKNSSKIVFRKLLKLSSLKQTIVYFLGRANRDFHMSYINISFDEVRQSIIDVINMTNTLNCQLIIKPHPAFSNAEQWITSWAPKGDYHIITNTSLNNALLSLANLVIVSKSSIAIEALEYEVPSIVFEHEDRKLHFFEELSSPLNEFEQQQDKPFIRATSYEELLHTCKTIIGDSKFNEIYRERCKKGDPWIYHNRDGLQVERITQFISEIIEYNINN